MLTSRDPQWAYVFIVDFVADVAKLAMSLFIALAGARGVSNSIEPKLFTEPVLQNAGVTFRTDVREVGRNREDKAIDSHRNCTQTVGFELSESGPPST